MSNSIKAARRWLHGAVSEGECCVCGGPDAPLDINRVVGASFTAFDALILGAGAACCEGCQRLLSDPALRHKHILSVTCGIYSTIERDQVWDILTNPPDKSFVLSVPQSYKKHHWLYAGLSTNERMVIGTDNRSVVYEPQTHAEIVDWITDMLFSGVGSRQIISGVYHPATYERYGAIELTDAEELLAPHRPTGLVELLTTYAPKPKRVAAAETEKERKMIDEKDKMAVLFLAPIAKASNLRHERGADFWDDIFPRRVTRFRHLPLAEVVSRLISVLAIPVVEADPIMVSLAALSAEDTATIESAMRARPKMIVSLVYAYLKQVKDKKYRIGEVTLWGEQ